MSRKWVWLILHHIYLLCYYVIWLSSFINDMLSMISIYLLIIVMIPNIYIHDIAYFYKKRIILPDSFRFLDLLLKGENYSINALICWSLTMLMRILSQCIHVRIHYLIKTLVHYPLHFIFFLECHRLRGSFFICHWFVKGELYVFAISFTCSNFSFPSYTTFLMKYKKGRKIMVS